MFKLIIWIDGIIMKDLALDSLDLDKRVKSCEGLQIRDKSIKKVITDRSLAENKIKRKRLTNECSLVEMKNKSIREQRRSDECSLISETDKKPNRTDLTKKTGDGFVGPTKKNWRRRDPASPARRGSGDGCRKTGSPALRERAGQQGARGYGLRDAP